MSRIASICLVSALVCGCQSHFSDTPEVRAAFLERAITGREADQLIDLAGVIPLEKFRGGAGNGIALAEHRVLTNWHVIQPYVLFIRAHGDGPQDYRDVEQSGGWALIKGGDRSLLLDDREWNNEITPHDWVHVHAPTLQLAPVCRLPRGAAHIGDDILLVGHWDLHEDRHPIPVALPGRVVPSSEPVAGVLDLDLGTLPRGLEGMSGSAVLARHQGTGEWMLVGLTRGYYWDHTLNVVRIVAVDLAPDALDLGSLTDAPTPLPTLTVPPAARCQPREDSQSSEC
ncbi:MAG: hypothetical protein DRQ55_08780 [Planctomycetota bacterium]|nr:MAG: hypothetical protein DRQ55_08780 [Planctomycetota bacterium]